MLFITTGKILSELIVSITLSSRTYIQFPYNHFTNFCNFPENLRFNYLFFLDTFIVQVNFTNYLKSNAYKK